MSETKLDTGKSQISSIAETIEKQRSDSIYNMRALAEELKPLLPEESQLIIDECVEQYERNDIVVMVAGEVSVGKSSLLNVLLQRPILLTDLTETTAAITYLRSPHGDRTAKVNMAKVTYNDGRVEWLELKKSHLMRVTTSLKNDDALHKVKKVDIYVPEIPPGITIVDTPGLNGGEKHSSLTRREMGLCHAALFLLDASKAGTLSEKQELNRLYDYAPAVFFVLTRWDEVRKANRHKTMEDVKKEYLDTIGKITYDATKGKAVSAENIYIVSAKEGLEACLSWTEAQNKNKAKVKSTGKNMQQKDVRDFLPDKGNENEIFDLFIDLFSMLESDTKNRMIRLRPLLTMSNLTQDALENIEEKIRRDSDTSELDLKIEMLTQELEKRKNSLLERNREAAERIIILANEEQQELVDAIEATREKVVSEMTQSIKNTSAFRNKDMEAMMDAAYQQKLKGKLDSILSSNILNNIQKDVNDFLTLVNNSFDTGETLTVNMPQQVAPTSDFSQISRQKQAMLENINTLKDGEEAIKREIATLQNQYDALTNEYRKCSEAKKKVVWYDSRISSIDDELKSMGPRPGAD
jgi:GTP-binding protein EngB required for normal cell division